MTKLRSINNINIRSVTVGVSWKNQDKQYVTKKIASFMKLSKRVFKESDIEIRTTRLTMPPLNQHKDISKASARSIVGWVSDLCHEVGIRWFCVPFDYTNDNSNDVTTVIATDIATYYPNAFINLIVARDGKINIRSTVAASKMIQKVSRLSNNGFDNFRIGVSCNCKPHTPFFPFSYHEGENDGFSIALEIVDMFIDVIQTHLKHGIEVVRDELVDLMSKELFQINELALRIENETGLDFKGIDASLAPFPNGESSVGKILELLGVDDFGSSSTLFFTSFLTNIIKNSLGKSGVRQVGFNGVMYSLLEDDCLALRAKQKNFSLESLTLYSSLCGCGVDMVPVPGDILQEEISGMIMDVAGMAVTLKKPLGFRILPIPAKEANELTNFNYDFLVDTRIMETKNRGSTPARIDNSIFTYLDEYNLRGNND
jgi:uncharacterized protein (UPF0210 family)